MVILSPLQKILWICKWFLIQIYNDASCYSYFYCYKYFLASSLLDPGSVCMMHQLIHMYCYYPPQIAGCVWVLHLSIESKILFLILWIFGYEVDINFLSLTYELLPWLIFYTFLFWDQLYQFWSCIFFEFVKTFLLFMIIFILSSFVLIFWSIAQHLFLHWHELVLPNYNYKINIFIV